MVVASRSVTELHRSPLHARSEQLGAKFAPFGGWEMPIEYAGGGVLAEHEAVRTAVGLFDVSHLGTAFVTGGEARAFLDRCFTNDLGRLAAGHAQYTLCCNDAGGVEDDLIAYVLADDEVLLVPNAANAPAVLARLRAAAPAGVTVTDAHSDVAIIAVQGPRSAAVLDAVGLPTDLDYLAVVRVDWHGIDVIVCRTGYTGEHGYEVLVPAASAVACWDALAAAAADAGGRACGLGARDTLRTEMGYALHGHELGPDITPLDASVSWAVAWDKPEFWGREALLARRTAGDSRKLVGLRATDRGIPRAGMRVLRDGAQAGTVTSGTFSPTLKVGIALALVERSVALASQVVVDVRGRDVTMLVVRPPFVPSDPR
ncbi:MAG: glycine cleavage system protein [Frankiales bacterium]|nr:glycine cleavage system protein [Frankiales bacterium]